MKKIIALLLVLMMAFSLVACGEEPAPAGNGGNGQSQSQGGNQGQPQGGSQGQPQGGSNDNNEFTVLKVDKDRRVSDIEITGMKMDKERYVANELISVTVTWQGEPADDAWIGIIPADIPHGEEEVNDQHETEYLYFTEMKSGDTFTFCYTALEPGDYTVRINESDSGGAELAWCAFKVTEGTADEPKTPSTPNEPKTPDEPTIPDEPTTPTDTTVPEGYGKYVNQGAVILYPTDQYQEGFMGGVEGIENGFPWIRLSILGDAFSEQKALCEQEHGSSVDYSLTEIKVGEHDALKCIYSDSAAYFMEVIIDTSFLNDEFWAAVAVKVDFPKSEGDLSMFEDETLWEIINSFYFDSSLKYSF